MNHSTSCTRGSTYRSPRRQDDETDRDKWEAESPAKARKKWGEVSGLTKNMEDNRGYTIELTQIKLAPDESLQTIPLKVQLGKILDI